MDVLWVLPQQMGQRVDGGADKAIKVIRRLSERVPNEVVKKRHERYDEYLRVHQKSSPPLALELATWTMVVTSVPACLLSIEQAFALL